MTAVRRRLKDLVRLGLKRPPLERLLSAVYRRAWRSLRDPVRRLAPQPRHYGAGERRTVVRYSLRWEFEPSSYCQWNHYFGFSDPVLDVLRAFAARSRVIVDVGANVGVYSLEMAAVAPPGHVVHAFEPHPATYDRLVRHRDLNELGTVVCHRAACGDRRSTARLFVSDRHDSGKTRLHPTPTATVDSGLDVMVVALDDVVTSLGLERLDLLKIDVEGYEPETLSGARRSIERFRPVIVVEITPRFYRDRPDPGRAAFDCLADGGYRFFAIAMPDSGDPLLSPVELAPFVRPESEGQANLLAVPHGVDVPAILEPARAR